MSFKSFSILFILLISLQIISAASIDMKDSLLLGETFIAKLSGNFYTQPTKSNVNFYRNGYLPVSFENFVFYKIGSIYYISAKIPTYKSPGDYSIVIEGIKYYQNGVLVEEDIVKNFKIINEIAPFSIVPGVQIAENGYSIKLENLRDIPLDVDYEIVNYDTLESYSSGTVNLRGYTKTLYFASTREYGLEKIIFKNKDSEYYSLSQVTTTPAVPDPICGNNVIEEGEECDEGSKNGGYCSAEYGSTCMACNILCQNQLISGSYCGDKTCDPEEDYLSCSSDCEEPVNPDSCTPAGFSCELNAQNCEGEIHEEFNCLGTDVCCEKIIVVEENKSEDETKEENLTQIYTCISSGYDCLLNEDYCSGTVMDSLTCENNKICCDFSTPKKQEDLTCVGNGNVCIIKKDNCQGGTLNLDCLGLGYCCASENIISEEENADSNEHTNDSGSFWDFLIGEDKEEIKNENTTNISSGGNLPQTKNNSSQNESKNESKKSFFDFFKKNDDENETYKDNEIVKTCEEQGYIPICPKGEKCTKKLVDGKKSQCCTGKCEKVEDDPLKGIIGWGLIIFIFLGLVAFFKTKFQKVKKTPSTLPKK